MSLGFNKSKSSSSSESSQAYDPELTAYLTANADRALGLADTPFQAYTGQRVAGFQPGQVAANDAYRGIVTDQVGGLATDAAKNAGMNVASFQPTNVNAGNVTAGQFAGTDLNPYFNPFLQNVISGVQADGERTRLQAQNENSAKAIAARAFGGSRQAVAQGVSDAQVLNDTNNRTAGLRYQGYNDATGLAVGDINRRLTADTGNRDAALTAQTANQTAASQAAALRLQGGNLLRDTSQQQLDQAIQRAGLLDKQGAAEQAIAQSGLDANYQEFLRGIEDPILKQQLLNQALGLVPNSPLTQSSSSSSSTSKGTTFGFGGLPSADKALAGILG